MTPASPSKPLRSVFLGVDVGTGSARAGLFDENGKLLGSSSSPIQIWKDGACVEQSSTDIWHAICAAVKAACSLAKVAAGEVKGLGFAATCSLVAVDADGSPVSVSWSNDSRRNVIVWMDHRAVDQAERINSYNSPTPEYTFLIYVLLAGNYFKKSVASIYLVIESELLHATPSGLDPRQYRRSPTSSSSSITKTEQDSRRRRRNQQLLS